LGAETVNEITRLVIAKAQRETRFSGRAVRVDSTVIELNSKAGAQIARSVREARRLAGQARRAARAFHRRGK
jgi:hypothetical protein